MDIHDEVDRIWVDRCEALKSIRIVSWIIRGVGLIGGFATHGFTIVMMLFIPGWRYIDGLLCKSRLTVLWLRRFDKKTYLTKLIPQASLGMVSVVTLRDSNVRGQTGLLATYAWLVVILPFVAAAVVIHALIPVAIAVVLIMLFIIRQFGFLNINSVKRLERAKWPGISSGKKSWPTNRLFVIKSANHLWQELVGHLLRNVDAVVCDVTDPSINIQWELDNVLKRFPPETVLLACALQPGDDTERLPAEIERELEGSVGAETLRRMRIFFYPISCPMGILWQTSLEKRMTEYLAGLIAVTVAGSHVLHEGVGGEQLQEIHDCKLPGPQLCPYCDLELVQNSNYCKNCELYVDPAQNTSPF